MVATTAAAAAPSRPRLAHVPALDGVRALCVLAVLAFHNGFGWAKGGFLGVSTFFTLSGFLITTLVLAERNHTGGVDLVAFWRRRFRRLLPATVACFALVIAFGLLAASAEQRSALGGDLAASAAYVANWWFLDSGQSYAELFAAPSPLLQFWSLAIEEQFYVLFPLLAWAVVRTRRGTTDDAPPARWSPAARMALVSVVLLAATTAIPFVLDRSQDWLYYATPARAPELLVGVVAAALLAGHRQRLTDPSARVRTAAGVVAALALAVMVAGWTRTAQSDIWLYEGGFAAFSVVSLALLVAVQVPGHPVTRLLSLRPVRHIGLVSYGLYLFHWPLFLWIDTARTGLDGWPLFAARLVATFAVAELSYRFIEQPVRTTGRLVPSGRLSSWTTLPRWAPAATALVVIGGFAVAATAPAPAVDIARAGDLIAIAAAQQAEANVAADTAAPIDITPIAAGDPAATPLRVGAFGDSTAMMTGFGLGAWLDQQPGGAFVRSATRLGCGLALGGDRRLADGRVESFPRWCTDWPEVFAQAARDGAPEIAMVQVGPWDIADRRLTPNGAFLSPGDPAWNRQVTDEFLQAVDTLAANGSHVVWLTAPPANAGISPRVAAQTFAGDARRFDVLNGIITRLPGLRPGKVSVVDLAAWHAALGAAEDQRLRPDGMHAGEGTSFEIAERFLGPALTQVWRAAVDDGSLAELRNAARARWADLPPLRAPALGEPLRVVVWGDSRAAEVAAAMPTSVTGGDGLPRAVEVSVVAPDECGVSPAFAWRSDGRVISTTVACRERSALQSALANEQPHVVVVVPGTWEQGELRAFIDGAFHGIYDHTTHTWVATQFSLAVDALRQSGVRPVIVNLNHVVDRSMPYANLAAPAKINASLDAIAASPSRRGWLSYVDLRTTGLSVGLAEQLAAALPPATTPPTAAPPADVPAGPPPP
jgi:peptidoglycan/LPS O-acetylase OafA/YrhL